MARKAGMSTGIEVARITVKVSPDTKEFRRELKNQLDDVEKGAKDKAKAKLDVDTAPAEKKVARSTKKIATTAQKNVSKIKLLDGDKDPLANFAKSMASFNAANKQVAAMQDKMGKLNLGFDKKKMAFRLENFKPQAEFAQQRAETNRIMQEFEIQYDRVRKSTEDIDVAFNPDLSRFNPKVIRNRIKRFLGTDTPIEIPVIGNAKGKRGSGGSGGDDGKSLLGRAKDALGGFELPKFGTGLNPSAWVAILSGILVVAAPILGLITTALLALPGLLSLVLAPIGAITLGLDGFKAAAEKIKPQFEELKKVMSEAAETSFTPVLQNLADTVFPLLQNSLPRVTQGLADFAQGAIDAFKDPKVAGKFEASISRIGEAFSAMRPGLDSFTSGFVGLLDAFTLKLPDITKWFNDTGKDFENWVNKITAGGDTSELSTAFDQLGGFIRTVLDLLGELALQGFDFIKQPGSLNGILTVFDNIKTALSEIAELSGKINTAWDTIFGARPGITQDMYDGLPQNVKDKLDAEGFKVEADGLKRTINEVGEEADRNKLKIDAFLGDNATAPNASRDRRGLAPVEVAPDTIPTPDFEPAKAEITEYQGFVNDVTQQVTGALSQATTGNTLPAPNFEEFKAAWSELPKVVQSSVDGVRTAAEGMRTAADESIDGIAQRLTGLGGELSGAVGDLSGTLVPAGNALMGGLKSGLEAGFADVLARVRTMAGEIAAEKGPLPYDKTVLVPNGEALMQGLGKGLENGFQPVLDQARDMAGKVADAFANGGDPTAGIAGYSKQDISRMEKVLAYQAKDLGRQAKALDYQAKTTGNDALKARADELRMQQDQITAQKDMLDLVNEYNGEAGSGDDPFVKAASGLMKSPVDFAKATGQQFMSDLGISGDGFISKAITEGISYVFNIGSVDEALSIKDRQDANSALAVTGR